MLQRLAAWLGGDVTADCAAVFNAYWFLLVFLPVAVGGYWLMRSRRSKLVWITAMSFLFYAFWDVRFVALLLWAAGIDYLIALRMVRYEQGSRGRHAWLALSMVVNLGVLAFFKYAVWAADNLRGLLGLFGVTDAVPAFSIVLPIGISFYTFQTMSYAIDAYRGTIEPTRDFVKYLAFVSLFPQLVAGPIVRYSSLDRQLDAIPRSRDAGLFRAGVVLFAIGLGKKVIIADSIARAIDPLWADAAGMTTATAWFAVTGFAMQLYFDFSGYSDMAVGLGAMLGLRLPINFRAPFAAKNPQQFWQRWHISLSSFIRDYVYLPLGGSKGPAWRAHLNVVFCMVLVGLWHGASWTFVAFGVWSALRLLVYIRIRGSWDALPGAVQIVANTLISMVGFAFFRAVDMTAAGQVLWRMVTWSPGGLDAAGAGAFATVLALLAWAMWNRNADRYLDAPLSRRRTVWAAGALVASLLLLPVSHDAFVYYQF